MFDALFTSFVAVAVVLEPRPRQQERLHRLFSLQQIKPSPLIMKRNPSASAGAGSSNKNGGDNNGDGWMTTRKVGRDDKQIKKAANAARETRHNKFRERRAQRRGQHHMKTYIMSSASDDAFVLLAGFDDLGVTLLPISLAFSRSMMSCVNDSSTKRRWRQQGRQSLPISVLTVWKITTH